MPLPLNIMDLLSGGDLRYHICRHRKFSEDETKFIICNIILGLEYIHSNKMFHRDIKPSNIIVRSNGSPVIIDFGLVKFNQERSYNLTRSRDIIGTCQYMPIEQVQKLLGHQKIDTTMEYAMVDQQNVKVSHKKFIG